MTNGVPYRLHWMNKHLCKAGAMILILIYSYKSSLFSQTKVRAVRRTDLCFPGVGGESEISNCQTCRHVVES